MLWTSNLVKLLVVAAVCGLFYSFGYTAADYRNEQQINKQLTELTTNYEARLLELNRLNEKLNDEVQIHIKDIAVVNRRADALRVQLKLSAENSACAIDRPDTAGKAHSGRPGKMAEIIGIATDIIQERDRIALDYNRLKSQCRLQ